MNKSIFIITCCLFAATSFVACTDSNSEGEIELPTAPTTPDTPDTPNQPSDDNYTEQYRPQIHFTPAKNWMNDPNGLVYLDGTYHMFYQYNPKSNDWGNLSWGHSTSTDLIHWTEKNVALSPDELGMIFSGSAVIDKDNTAGFGKNAIVAIYTSADAYQQQSLAYSTDGGATFQKYEGNPVIKNTELADFRDPKIFWHDDSKQWIMSLALGWQYGIQFWASKDLKNWTKLSTFTTSISRCNRGQWECPDLLQMDYNGTKKWVLIISVNPGGPTIGSGTMYFVGDFDGNKFTADALDYPLWLDYGADNYAGVTWSNTPGRTIYIGWMNNWQYAGASPVSPWRSAFTLPRELSLHEYNGKPLLYSNVVKELEASASEWKELTANAFDAANAYEVELTMPIDNDAEISLVNKEGEHLDYTLNAATNSIIAHRNNQTGKTSFNGNFSLPSVIAPLNTEGNNVTLRLYIDQSSVELFTGNGSMAQTLLVYPKSIYNSITINGKPATGRVRTIKSIWK